MGQKWARKKQRCLFWCFNNSDYLQSNANGSFFCPLQHEKLYNVHTPFKTERKIFQLKAFYFSLMNDSSSQYQQSKRINKLRDCEILTILNNILFSILCYLSFWCIENRYHIWYTWILHFYFRSQMSQNIFYSLSFYCLFICHFLCVMYSINIRDISKALQWKSAMNDRTFNSEEKLPTRLCKK